MLAGRTRAEIIKFFLDRGRAPPRILRWDAEAAIPVTSGSRAQLTKIDFECLWHPRSRDEVRSVRERLKGSALK